MTSVFDAILIVLHIGYIRHCKYLYRSNISC